jgi:hypothetical protein
LTGSRRAWWAAAVAVVLAAVWLLGPEGRAPEATGSSQHAATVLAALPEPDAPAPAAARNAHRGDPPSPSTGEDEVPPQIQQFLAATVYPPTSQPLRPGSQDLLNPDQRYEKPRPLGKNREVTFVFTADRYYYTGDKVAHVWLEVLRGNAPADGVRVHRAIALAEGESASSAPVDLGLRRDGARWSSDLELEKEFPEHHGTILLQVAFAVGGGEVHEEAIRIFTTPPDRIPARLTGNFLDFVREGSLYVEMGVEVFEAGFFRFDANLYDRNGDPVAFSVFKGDLPAGEQWVPLEFFGKVLRDEGALAPYTVEQIRGYRFLDGQTPDRERMADEPFTHRTAAYDLARFSDEEYTSEHKERMLELMREDVAAGRTLDVPPLAAPPR